MIRTKLKIQIQLHNYILTISILGLLTDVKNERSVCEINMRTNVLLYWKMGAKLLVFIN